MFTISLLSHLYLRLVTHSPVSSHVALVGDGPRELFEGGVDGYCIWHMCIDTEFHGI